MTKIPDTSNIDMDAVLKMAQAINGPSDAWQRLEAVVVAALDAAAREKITTAQAQAVIESGIEHAKLALAKVNSLPRSKWDI